ncbi:hypothetical protein F5884DRAFT_829186 [Xylogone sp. PMI_703]|nr:hypothetical protein F5884DRAFT_829186 [Xylogone sp. PMI_703]
MPGFYYFKLLMNGAHIASWGIDTKTMPSGQVARGLFEPSGRRNYKYSGIFRKSNGAELRRFYFSDPPTIRSAASDGGLIEVLVFRATGRKQKVARKESFRDQEKYGIRMPSNGLFGSSRDAQYYEWYLRDPRDRPFVSFSFHYRSWDYLHLLEIIPSSYSNSPLRDHHQIQSLTQDDNKDEDDAIGASPGPEDVSTPWKVSSSDDDSSESPAEKEDVQDPFVDPPNIERRYIPRAPTSRFLRYESEQIETVATPPPVHQTHKIPPRPLPGPSKQQFPRGSRLRPHSRTPSISSSLLQYVERDTESPEPLIDTAVAMPVVANCNSPDTSPHKISSLTPTVSSSSIQLRTSSTPITPRIEAATSRSLFSRASHHRNKQLELEHTSPSRNFVPNREHIGSCITTRPGTKLRHNYRPPTPVPPEGYTHSYVEDGTYTQSLIKNLKAWYNK